MKNNNTWIGSFLSSTGYIVLNKELIKKLGLNSTALICELCSEYRYYEENDKLVEKEWFYSTIPNIEENTGLTRYQQEESIKKLTEKDILSTKLMGMPSKRYFKINWKMLERIIKENIQNDKKCQNTNKKSPKIQGCKKLATKDAGNSQTRLLETRKQGSKKLATKDAGNSQTRLLEIRKQGCKKLATKDARNSQTRLQETSKQGCKKLAPKSNNITLINNNNKNNNLILSDQEEMRKDKNIFSQFLKNIKITELKKELLITEKEMLDDILNNVKEILDSNKEYYLISGDKIKTSTLKEHIMTLNEDHIIYIIKSLKNTTTNIKNIKSYINTCLWNAKKTINIYYTNQVNHDMSEHSKKYA